MLLDRLLTGSVIDELALIKPSIKVEFHKASLTTEAVEGMVVVVVDEVVVMAFVVVGFLVVVVTTPNNGIINII